MKFFDQARAITRLVLFNSEQNTVSEQARQAAEAARIEREKTTKVIDELLSSLVRRRVEKQMEQIRATSAESTNGTHP